MKSNELVLKDAIKSLLSAYKLNDGINEIRLVKNWEKIAGPYIAKYTENIYLKKKTLFVKLTSPAIKNELSFAKSKLIESLNKSIDKHVIDEIVFL